jgi:hypothetical protein
LPVRFLRSLQYRRLHWVQPRHTSSSSLSVRHRPAVCAVKSGSFSRKSHLKSVSQLGWSVETPRPALAVCCLSRVAIGSVETEAHHSICNPWVEAQEPWASERGHSRQSGAACSDRAKVSLAAARVQLQSPRQPSGSLLRGGGDVLISAASMDLLSKPAFGA